MSNLRETIKSLVKNKYGKQVRYSQSINADVLKRIDRMAVKLSMSRNELVTRICEAALEDLEEEYNRYCGCGFCYECSPGQLRESD